MDSIRRGARLLERPVDDLGPLLAHPAQLGVRQLVRDMVEELRGISTAGEFYEFQRELAGLVFDAQTRQAGAARNAKRETAGRNVPVVTAGSWRLELAVWDRVVRQLRSIGDALAWRLFRFDRRFIIALSQSAPPSPIVNKEGLDYELGYIKETWESDGQFALMHDLTNSVRIGDLTIFTHDGPRIAEVKKSRAVQGGRHAEQVRRVQHAVDVLNNDAPIIGSGGRDTYLEVSDLPLKTNFRVLRENLELSSADGAASRSFGRQQVLTTLNFTPGAIAGRILSEPTGLKSKAFGKAGLDRCTQLILGNRIDCIGKDHYLAPLTIFPLPPDVVANLATDGCCFEYAVGWDRIESSFRHLGFEVETLFASRNGEIPTDVARLYDAKANVTMTLHRGMLDQLLHELLDVDRFVEGVARRARERGAKRRSSVFIFGNERAVWR